MGPPQTMPKMVPSSGEAASWGVTTMDHGLPPIFPEMGGTSKKPLVSRPKAWIWDEFGDSLLIGGNIHEALHANTRWSMLGWLPIGPC